MNYEDRQPIILKASPVVHKVILKLLKGEFKLDEDIEITIKHVGQYWF